MSSATPIVKTSYTKRGYALNKKYYTEDELKKIRKDLMVAPFSLDEFNKPEPFPIFLESPSKLYVPKHYGFEKFGEPDEIKISRGEPISAPFVGQLKPIQIEIIKKYLETCIFENDPDPCKFSLKSNGGLISVGCGVGKCTARDTPVLMYDGTIKMVQDVQVGDQLMGDDSTPRNVLSLARGREIMYRVVQNKGDDYVVNKSHILSLKVSTHMSKKMPKGAIVDMSVTEYLNLPKSYHGRGGTLLGYKVPVVFPPKEVDFDPYMLGYWLGDGNSRTTGFSTQDATVLYGIRKILKDKYPDLYISYASQYDYRITSVKKGIGCNPFMNFLKKNNLILNKHIPHVYKCNSRDIQLQVLAGIIDSDGSLSQKGYDINLKNERLLDDVIYIARSLGFAAFKTKCEKSCMYKGEKRTGTYYRTYIYGNGIEEIPVKVPRKKAEPRKQIKDPLATRIRLEELPEDDYYGFELDGNRRYLLGDFTVTHNTVMGIKLIAELGRKALVVVHKEFLMNQWKERIAQFMPSARVGTIQGKTLDVENKDIVLCMLQSLSMKDYPDEVFNGFGTAVIDECFPYDQSIITENGAIKIGELYTMWENNEPLPRVKAYNESTKSFEWKRITYAWEKENKDLLEIQCSQLSFRSTLNHKYLTTNGWQTANSLQIGDLLISYGEKQMKVESIQRISNDINRNKVYDIEVEDHHNFVICGKETTNGVVVHNCHHIAAEVFSRALPKINSYYSIALSATPKRSDGLSKVFHMYLGPFVYKMEKREDKKIHIHTINYYDTDEDYSKEELTCTGKLCLPRMINNLAAHGRRNDMIEALVRKLVAERGAEPRKILILSDRREHLNDLHRRCSQFATTGFYIGGMKQKDLDESATKQVIFGTYPMSSEGLDIGDLNTCIFTTPKTSIEQSVGRIIRKDHAILPLAFDIVDHYSLFPAQYKKRETVYRKLDYDIYEHHIEADETTSINGFLYQLDQPVEKKEVKRRRATKCASDPVKMNSITSYVQIKGKVESHTTFGQSSSADTNPSHNNDDYEIEEKEEKDDWAFRED